MACEIDFNPATLSWRSTVDNLGVNLAGPERSAALRVKRVREIHLLDYNIEVVIITLLEVRMVDINLSLNVFSLTKCMNPKAMYV